MHFTSVAHGEDVTSDKVHSCIRFTSLKKCLIWAGIRMSVYAVAARYLVNRADRHLFGNRIFDCCGCLGYGTVSGDWGAAGLTSTAGDDSIRVKLQTYNAGWLTARAQDENRSAWAATRGASWAFRGNLMKLFVFDLSFIGWYILIAVVLWGCILLGTVGLTGKSTGIAIAVFAAALVAALCLTTVLNGFSFGVYGKLVRAYV